MGMSPFNLNLDLMLTENFVLRCFTKWYEIIELTIAKRSLAFGAKMLSYGLLPSNKYRLHLQKAVLGSPNVSIYAGYPALTRGGRAIYGLFDLIQNYLEKHRQQPISDEYFVRLVTLLRTEKIPFYYIPAPMDNARYEQYNKKGKRLRLSHRLQQLERQYDNFHFMEKLQLIYPKERFPDGTHLDTEGVAMANRDLAHFLNSVLQKDQPEYTPMPHEKHDKK